MPNVRLAQLNQRLQQNAKYQEGKKPAEHPADFMLEYQSVADQLEKLVVEINQAN
ncbi:hypothetical protein AAUPMC_08852, partial [Pasteurella multocida subsp. multocida str. Anand1_cattle]